MKRCPECRRDYYDETLLYCLDDGNALLEGPASGSEPATAILHETTAPHEAATRAQIHMTEAERQGDANGAQERQKFFANRAAKPLAALAITAVVLAGAFFGYRYLSSGGGQINSIAVLPFENSGGNPDSEYLSDGLAESLIYRLSQIPDLKVSPRSSVFRYKGQSADAEKVGNELAVDAVMSGRLVQRGDSLTISVDLVDVRNKKTLWGEQFERKMSDLLSTQREIASAITEKLQLRLSGSDTRGITKPYTSSNEAYQLYLKGRFHWNKRTAENVRKSIELLKSATEKDPDFALAYAGLADSYVVASTYTGERAGETMPQAKAYALKAIELDSTLAEPHAALGLATWFFDWNKEAAEKEFKLAIELNPNYPTTHHFYSRFLRGLGRTAEGCKEIKKAADLDPLSLIFVNNVAECYIDLGELDLAEREIKRMTELDPNFWAAYQTLTWIKVKQGNDDEALAAAEKGVALSNRSNAALSQMAHVYGRLGRVNEAKTTINELEQKFANKIADGRDLAVAYVGLGDKDRAFEWLEKAFAYRSFQLTAIRLDPLLEPLRDDPRWKDLERRVGLPQ